MCNLNKKALFGIASVFCLVLGGVVARADAASELPAVPKKITSPGILGHLQEAYRAAAAKPDDPQAVGNYCLTLQVYRQATAAVACHKRLQGLKSADSKWLYYQALTQADAGQLAESTATLDRFVKQQPDYLAARIRLGAGQLAAKQPTAAVATFQAAVKQNPRSAQAQYGLGRALEASGDKKGAIAAYRQALALAPRFGAPAGRLADLLAADGDKGEVQQLTVRYRRYQKVGAPDPDPLLAALHRLDRSAPAQARRGVRAAARGDLAAATQSLEAALASDPSYLPAHVALIDLYRRQKAYDKAESHYRKALELRPNAYLAEINYGRSLQDQAKTDLAAAAYRRALKIDPARATGYLLLGGLLERKGQTKDALEQYQTAAKRQPTRMAGHFQSGRLLLKTGQTSAASAAFDKAVVASSRPALTLLRIGNLYGEAKQPSEALRRLEQARQRASANGQKRLLAAIEKAQAKWQATLAKPAEPAAKQGAKQSPAKKK